MSTSFIVQRHWFFYWWAVSVNRDTPLEGRCWTKRGAYKMVALVYEIKVKQRTYVHA